MHALAPADVLALWERGANRHPIDRSALLCAWARPEIVADDIADLPLGAVNESLLRLRAASFGARIDGHVDCMTCGQRLAIALNTRELLQPSEVQDEEAHAPVDVAGLRAPCLRDLAAIADEPDVEQAARRLLVRCMAPTMGPSAGDDADVARLPDAALHEAEQALETLDPNADLVLGVHCEACGRHSSVQLDAGMLLWDEIDARARALLGQVHALARAYGWTEAEILALAPARRASYLSMVGA